MEVLIPSDGFVHLHSHSEYSMRDATMSVKKYVKRVKELGMTACALTDHGNMHGVHKFYKAAKEAGIKPIIGLEAYVIPFKEMAQSEDRAIKHIKYHFTLLAKDETGYHQLAKATTKAQLLKDKKTYPRMTYEDMKTYFIGGHVIALSGCVQGELSQILLDQENENAYEEAKNKALFYQSIFGKGNFFIEIQNHGLDLELEVLPKLILISKETGIPLVATNDCHYAEKADSSVRDWIVALRFGQKVTDPEFQKDCGELYIKSAEEMAALFEAYPEALANTVKIAEMCNLQFTKAKRFPLAIVPDGKSEDEYLRELTMNGMKHRFPDYDSFPAERKQAMMDRIEHELGVISKLHYSGYLIIVQDFLQEGRRLGMVGPGRGSAVGSFVCYLIGITDVNPLPYNLLFERFLNMDRVSDPDIDSDFCDMRDEVIEYVKRIYGNASVCSIITFGTMAARAAIRNVGRVTGRSLELCDRVAKMIPNKPGIMLVDALEENPELKKAYEEDASVRTLFEDAKKVEGLVIQSGVHAAGIIIADRDISDYVPLMYDEDKNLWICQFDKKDSEGACGLLKMDFLGLKNLTIIKRTLQDIERNHGVKMTIYDIPLDDKEVFKEVFAAGKTKAVFQFESSGMVQLLKRFQPERFEDLILLNAAYRPGPIQYLDEIIETKHGRKKPSYIVKELEKILSVTYGKPIYQEQIQQIFNQVAGFSLGVADIIRRAMAAKDLAALEAYLPEFQAKLIDLGASKEQAEQFAKELMEFAKYAFNKSHSTAYAFLAFITAWLKLHYPVEYMANVLSVASTKELPVYIKEARDMKIPVLPPSINESGKFFTPTKAGAIRFGLSNIKNVGKSADVILSEREANGDYRSVHDFINRQLDIAGSRAVYKQVRESLILTGAFDEFGLNRHQTLIGCESLLDAAKSHRAALKALPEYEEMMAQKLSELIAESPSEKEITKFRNKVERGKQTRIKNINATREQLEVKHFPSISEYEKNRILELERELIGFYASGHPLDDYQQVIESKSDFMIGDIDEDANEKYVTVVGQITDFKQLFRKSDGAGMGKFVLEDLTGGIECIAFTKTFAQYQKKIVNGEVVMLRGRVMVEIERDEEGEIINADIQLNVQEVSPITFDQKVYIRIPNKLAWDMAKEIVSQHAGSAPLYVYVGNEKKVYKTKLFVKASGQFLDAYTKLFGDQQAIVS